VGIRKGRLRIDRLCLTDMEKQPKSAWVSRWQES
jgi:hypothetical protein